MSFGWFSNEFIVVSVFLTQKCHLWSYEWWTACEHPVCPDTSLITVCPENYL